MDEEKKPELKFVARKTEYKGYPILVLTSGENEKYPFQFGYQKAKRIVECFDDIKAFVAECESAKAAEQTKTVAVK